MGGGASVSDSQETIKGLPSNSFPRANNQLIED